MMKHRERRELLNKMCYNCQNDCKRMVNNPSSNCVNFVKGYSSAEYWDIIRQDGINLKKLCEKKKLSLNMMYKMLNNKIHFTYKYRVALDSRIHEKHEYDEYIVMFENNKIVDFGFDMEYGNDTKCEFSEVTHG